MNCTAVLRMNDTGLWVVETKEKPPRQSLAATTPLQAWKNAEEGKWAPSKETVSN